MARPSNSPAVPHQFLTIRDVADRLQVSTRTVRRWIAEDELVVHRLGRGIRISTDDFAVFVRTRRETHG